MGKNSPIKVLFVGNSATYVHDIPGMLARLAQKAGYDIECNSVVKGGATLSMHADASLPLGQKTLNAIQAGHDIVFVQDNGNCVSSDEMRAASIKAAETLAAAIHGSGAKAGIYIRPPYGYETWGNDPVEQCIEFDKHFLAIADSIGSVNVHVNRAFAYAIKNANYNLWGPDNGHTSEHGAYLATCVFFATFFNTSSAVLDSNGLPPEDARDLQIIANKIALDGEMPW